MSFNIKMIVAHDKNQLIGVENKLPWNLPEDMKHFINTTKGKVVVMGRNTYDSIGIPLKDRENVVLTRSNVKIEGVKIFKSIEEVINHYKELNKEIIIIGGVEIYKQFLPYTNTLIVTEIEKEYKGDAYFPEYKNDFMLFSRTGLLESKTGLKYEIKVYEK